MLSSGKLFFVNLVSSSNLTSANKGHIRLATAVLKIKLHDEKYVFCCPPSVGRPGSISKPTSRLCYTLLKLSLHTYLPEENKV